MSVPPIQRFIIFHLGLLPGDASVSIEENISNEELCEHILYYQDFRDAVEPSKANIQGRREYNIEEAVKFAGLCTALHTIQANIDGQMNIESSSKTKEVYLSNCILSFVQLEESEVGGILAVIQFAKEKDSRMNSFLSSIRDRILKAHNIFQDTHKGIHQRLLSAESEESDVQDYGMSDFFSLHKRIKILRYNHFNACSESERIDIDHELNLLYGQLNKFSLSLPVNQLRNDLKGHYDSYFNNMSANDF